MNLGKTHAVFNCEDCDESFHDFMKAQRQANYHAKRKRHKVVGDVAYFFEYDGRKP